MDNLLFEEKDIENLDSLLSKLLDTHYVKYGFGEKTINHDEILPHIKDFYERLLTYKRYEPILLACCATKFGDYIKADARTVQFKNRGGFAAYYKVLQKEREDNRVEKEKQLIRQQNYDRNISLSSKYYKLYPYFSIIAIVISIISIIIALFALFKQ